MPELAGRLYIPKLYHIDLGRHAVVDLLKLGVERSGGRVVYSSFPDEMVAPVYLGAEDGEGRRYGLLVYPFTTTRRVTRNRPADEHRLQIRLGAADGIDELLVGFAPLERPAVTIAEHYVLAVHCQDTDDRWTVTLDQDGLETHRRSDPADSVVEGLASDLYLALWNRHVGEPRLVVSGDPRGLELWRATLQVGWN